jgi:hypothetical protein
MPASASPPDHVWVQVVELDSERQIGWGSNLAQHLHERIGDIRDAVVSGSSTVAQSIGDLTSPEGWELEEVTASFGVALAAEAGAILTKASGEATFEVSVTFKRKDGHGEKPAGS